MIVSKNLVEMLACLVIATTPSGHWIGFDALFFRRRRRGKLAAATVGNKFQPLSQSDDRPARDQQPIALDQSTGLKHPRAFSVFKEPPMTNLTPEQRVLGRENADQALGVSRRDMLKAAAAVPALGAFYFGYKGHGRQGTRSRPPSSAPATKAARR